MAWKDLKYRYKVAVIISIIIVIIILILLGIHMYTRFNDPPPIFNKYIYPAPICLQISNYLYKIYVGYQTYEKNNNITPGTVISAYVDDNPIAKKYKQLLDSLLSTPSKVCAKVIGPGLKYLQYLYPTQFTTGQEIHINVKNIRDNLIEQINSGGYTTYIAELEACKAQAIKQLEHLMSINKTAANGIEFKQLIPKIKNFYAQLIGCLNAYSNTWETAYNRFYKANPGYRTKSTAKAPHKKLLFKKLL